MAKVNKFTRQSQDRLEAVFKESVQRVIDQAQTPLAKGGLMRVDTGFLRNSGAASLVGMPTGPSRSGGGSRDSDEAVALIIAEAGIGDTIWFGWTASYARAREAKDGFLRTAVLDWQSTVAQVAKELKDQQ